MLGKMKVSWGSGDGGAANAVGQRAAASPPPVGTSSPVPQQLRTDNTIEAKTTSSPSHAAKRGGGGVDGSLPVNTMDVEVFERYIMRVLTSLHRLVAKVCLEIHVDGAHCGGGGGGGRGGGGHHHHAPHDDEDSIARHLWTLVRRITRRIEKLCVVAPILDAKRLCLLRAMAPRAGATATTNTDAAAQGALQSDLLLVEALITKVQQSVDEFMLVETQAMQQLCQR